MQTKMVLLLSKSGEVKFNHNFCMLPEHQKDKMYGFLDIKNGGYICGKYLIYNWNLEDFKLDEQFNETYAILRKKLMHNINTTEYQFIGITSSKDNETIINEGAMYREGVYLRTRTSVHLYENNTYKEQI